MIDPYFSRRGVFPVALGRIKPDLPRIRRVLQRFGVDRLDAIALTHTHYDHALDAPEIARLTHAPLAGGRSAMILGTRAGLPSTQRIEIHPRQTLQVGNLSLTFHLNSHLRFPGILDRFLGARDEIYDDLTLPAHALAYRAGEVYSILIEDKSSEKRFSPQTTRRLLVLGSTGYIRNGLEGCHADVCCLSSGGLDWKSRSYLLEYFRESVLVPGAKRVILTHWDDFTRPLDVSPKISRRIEARLNELRNLCRDSGIILERAAIWQNFEI